MTVTKRIVDFSKDSRKGARLTSTDSELLSSHDLACQDPPRTQREKARDGTSTLASHFTDFHAKDAVCEGFACRTHTISKCGFSIEKIQDVRKDTCKDCCFCAKLAHVAFRARIEKVRK